VKASNFGRAGQAALPCLYPVVEVIRLNIAIYQIAYRIGMHPNELAKAVREGEVTGEVPGNNPQSKEAWVDLLSLRNYIHWMYEKGQISEMSFLKSIRHIDQAIKQSKA
jgi:hypothetical protein